MELKVTHERTLRSREIAAQTRNLRTKHRTPQVKLLDPAHCLHRRAVLRGGRNVPQSASPTSQSSTHPYPASRSQLIRRLEKRLQATQDQHSRLIADTERLSSIEVRLGQEIRTKNKDIRALNRVLEASQRQVKAYKELATLLRTPEGWRDLWDNIQRPVLVDQACTYLESAYSGDPSQD